MDYWRLGLAYLLGAACVLHTASAGGRRKEIAGPYVIVPRQIDECSVKGTNEFRIVSSKLLKIRRDVFSYSTDVIAPYGLSDQMTVGMRCAVYGNGGWKDNAYNFNFGGACQALKTLVPGAFEFIKRQFGSFNDCPIPPVRLISLIIPYQ
ncbi:hypothetical protein AAG570_010479 [Ranatra chinensis]|uniref:Uncharacterized protein n=1 Tax=Ranatra chinensis TaxID=642074 RepID=A0ABD0ZAZ9_9HEMI